MSLDAPATPPDISPPPSALHGLACSSLTDDRARLACFDDWARSQSTSASPLAPAAPVMGASAPSAATSQEGARTVEGFARAANRLGSFWELDASERRGTFRFTGYRPNFFLPVQVNSHINRTPSSPNPINTVSQPLPDYRTAETKVQLSVRTKIAEGLVLPGSAVWFTYTQQSHWQLYSTSLSAPFRSTDHEPELLYVVPMPADLPAGWRLRMGALGLVHQSNGQTLPLSRSWNRVVAAVGAEKGELALVARLNQRLREDPATNDNPDLVAFRGRWDLGAFWTPGFATASLQWRTNFDRRGSLQLDWTFPVDTSQPQGLRWYAQAFAGYGESLLDYNFRKASLGFGVTLFGW